MRVIVTGGAGFIGANLVRRLVATPEIEGVVVIDDLSTASRSNLAEFGNNVAFQEGTVLDQALIAQLIIGIDAVVHLAARPSVPRSIADPMASHRTNVDGTMNILEAARSQSEPPLVVFASSSSVYGSNPTLPKHEDLATRPMSPYAASKLAGESYALAYQAAFGVATLPFRFFNVFGPLQTPGHAYAAVVPAFLSAALRNESVEIHGDGLQTRDFTYVGTVTEVITQAIVNRTSSTTPVNLAFGTRCSLLDLLALLEGMLGQPISRHHVGSRAGDVRDSQASNDRLRALFPAVQPMGLEQGLACTLDWMRSVIERDALGHRGLRSVH